MRLILPIMLFAASVCLALGLVLPLIRLERLYFFTQEPSLVELVQGLWLDGEVVLALLVGLFSIVFPVVKLGTLHVLSYGASHERPVIPGWLKTLSNWSMLDVLLVALVIFAAKTSGLAAAFTQPGLWFFTASAVLTAVASALEK